MTKKNEKSYFYLLTIIVTLFLIGYFLEDAIGISSTGIKNSFENYLEISAELLSVFVSFSIFAMTWYAYGKSRDNHSLFWGSTFFVTGILILFHTFSYPFMPDFITPNSSNKSAFFFIESRLILALLFFAGVYIHKDTLPGLINKPVLLSFVTALSAISLGFVLLYNGYLFTGYYSFSTATVFLLSIITAFFLYASYLYARRLKKTGEKYLIFLIYGFIIIAFSNFVYFSYKLSGHFLTIAGFLYIHLALYKSSVILPYDKLALAEEKLRNAAEEKYRNLVDYANDAIIITGLEDRVTSWNRSAEEIFGWTEQEVMGKKLSQLIVPPSLLAERERILKKTLTGRTFSGIETVRLRKDGAEINVSITVSPVHDTDKNIIGYSGIIRDVTERKRVEKTLQESEERYRSLVESTDDSIYLVDRNCRYLFMNAIHKSRLGISDDTYIGRSYSEIHSAPEAEDFSEIINSVFDKGMPEQHEYESEGQWFLRTFSPVKNPKSGKITGITVISTNITERKKAEELRIENLCLANANRTKSEFLAVMSHELRTPLNSIIGFSELLKRGMAGELNGEQGHFVDNVLTSSKHLLALINDILDLSKVESGKMNLDIEKIYLPGVINETLALIKERAAKRNVIIKRDFDSQLVFIEADGLRFKQILFNLLDNAVKFCKKEGGTVTITIKKTGDMAQFSVYDTGIGIKEEDIEKLFNKFSQVDSGISRKYGGTGLGLAITKQLVELHGGKIWAESKFGEGSTFIFLLPVNTIKQEER